MQQLLRIFNIIRLIKAAFYALIGLKGALRHEAAFQLEIFLSVILFPLACYLGHTGGGRALLIGSWFLVMIIELLNTALETVVNRIGPQRHPLSGQAKDLAAAAVLVAVINAVIIWSLIIFQ